MRLISELAKIAAANPKKIALITEKSQMTFEDLLQLIHVLDVQLTTRGVRAGQTVVFTGRRPEFCIALAFLLSLRGLTLIYSDHGSVVDAGIAVDRVIGTEPDPSVPAERYLLIENNWFAAMGTLDVPDYTKIEGGYGTFVFRSSGSTGTPKYVRSGEVERIAQMGRAAFLDSTDLRLRRVSATMAPQTGWSTSISLATLIAGGSLLVLTEAKENILPYLDLHRIDTLCTTPAILQIMRDLPNAQQYLTSVRDIRLGGSLATTPLLKSFAAICPARIQMGYGAAEIGACFRAYFDPEAVQGAGYVGKFIRDDLEVAFFDEGLTPQPGADEGIIGFRPREGQFARQYLSQDDSTTGYINGYFIPGDIMRRDGDDYFIIGRVKNIVNVSGNKFSLETVRQALELSFPGNTLVPIPFEDADGIERLAVAYRGLREISPEEMTSAIGPRFTGLKVLRARRVDEIPLTESGKIDSQRLKAMFYQG